jgi:hypothetical protein
LLLEGDSRSEDGDVVIGREQGDQADGHAAQGLGEAQAIEPRPGSWCVHRFWREQLDLRPIHKCHHRHTPSGHR